MLRQVQDFDSVLFEAKKLCATLPTVFLKDTNIVMTYVDVVPEIIESKL